MYSLVGGNARLAANSVENALYSCDLRDFKADILEKYAQSNAIYQQIGSRLRRHSRIAPGVFLSEFDKGSLVINYTEKIFSYHGKSVQPNDFMMIEAVKEND